MTETTPTVKPFNAAGAHYTALEVGYHRQNVIQMRDAALQGGNFAVAVLLSHNVAILAHLIEEMGAPVPAPKLISLSDSMPVSHPVLTEYEKAIQRLQHSSPAKKTYDDAQKNYKQARLKLIAHLLSSGG